MSTPLDPFGSPITVGSVTLRTPGLTGTAESHPASSPGLRAAELSTMELEEALHNANVEPQETIELVDTAEIDVGGLETRSTAYDEPGIELEVPAPGEGLGQVVLYVDEAGVMSWSFATGDGGTGDTLRGGGATRTYVVRRFVPPAVAAAETRGLTGAVGKKLLKVLVFPLVDPLVGEVGRHFAHRWEEKKRPYRVRSFTPDDYGSPDAHELDADAWHRFSAARALLFVHGTLSRAHTGFGRLPRDEVESLHHHYGGRVFAFDHFTLSEDPKQNVEWFARQIPDGATLEVDIVCHSRGGLVSRVLAEKQSELSLGSRTVRIDKIVFVATPNAGTALTDAKYLGDLVDTYTNLLNFFPDTGVVEVLEGVVTVAKQVAVGVLKGLDGLQAMRPHGPFLDDWLNSGARDDKHYFALGSNYEPADAGLASFRDRLMDWVFKRAENDLVVPTVGVYGENGSAFFPIEDRYVFTATDAVPHTRFFANPTAREKINEWLTSSRGS
jgi:hypothetical protein